MTFAKKLRMLRKQAGLSQEQLAEKLDVSRQAITKWESEGGMADIENLKAISALFAVSIDELLDNEKAVKQKEGYRFESMTEYDIDRIKHFDMSLGGAKQVKLYGYEGEKLRICLMSDTLANLQSEFKVKIDDGKNGLDVDVKRFSDISEAAAKEELVIMVWLPLAYMKKIEMSARTETVELHALACESIELNVKAKNIILEDVAGSLEIDCNLDMQIDCHSLKGDLAINQLSAASRLILPKDAVFATLIKGIRTSIAFAKNGQTVESFAQKDAKYTIELNGMNAELIICTAE